MFSLSHTFLPTFVVLGHLLVVGAAADHLGLVLRLLVDGGGPEDSSLGGLHSHQHLDGTSLGQLAVQFIQLLGELGGGEKGEKEKQEK